MLSNLFEQRAAISYQTLWGAGLDIDMPTQAGVVVNPDTALTINPIFAAVSLISDTLATLPWDAYIRRDGSRNAFRPKPAWVEKPDIDTTKAAHIGAVMVSLLLDGNAFIRIFRNPDGTIVNLTVLNPRNVEIKRSAIGRLMFNVVGEKSALTSDEILFIPDLVQPGEIRGLARWHALKDNWALASALESYAARFFGQGATTQGIIEFPGNLTPEQAKNLADGFDNRHKGFRKAHKTGVLTGGASYKQTSVPNDQAQFLDSRRMAVEDVARAYNLPTWKLGLPGTNTYSSTEQAQLAFVTDTIRPYAVKLENAYSTLLNQEPGGEFAFIRFSLDGLLRADIQNRMAAYSTGLNSGFLTVNDVRRYEDLSPMTATSADQVRVPLANVNIAAADLPEQTQKVEMLAKLVQVGFDPASAIAALGLPAMTHTGLPSTQLQQVAQIDPTNPASVYEVE